jgi:hypothetical protein
VLPLEPTSLLVSATPVLLDPSLDDVVVAALVPVLPPVLLDASSPATASPRQATSASKKIETTHRIAQRAIVEATRSAVNHAPHCAT